FERPFGTAGWVVRLPAFASWLAGAWMAHDLARRIYGTPRDGAWAVLVWSSLPFVQAGFHLTTPDTPLVIFGWATFYFSLRALLEGRPGLWAAAGAFAGLTLLGKYTGLISLAAIFLGVLLSPGGRRQLATPWPWLGGVLALVVFSPVLIWNAQNEWISFLFQLDHGIKAQSDYTPAWALGQFIIGQMGMVMPWTLIAMIGLSLRPGMIAPLRGASISPVLIAGFWVPLVFFGYNGMTHDGGGPNWPLMAYVPGTLLLAGGLNRWLSGFRRPIALRTALVLISLCFAFSLLILNLVRYPQLLHTAGVKTGKERTQLTYSYDWPILWPKAAPMLEQQEVRYGTDCLVLVDDYQNASMAALMLGSPRRIRVALDGRFSQFHLWQQAQPPAPDNFCLAIRQNRFENRFSATHSMPGRKPFVLYLVIPVETPDGLTRWFGLYRPQVPPGTP
ncbi:MAG: glycosyltransferase family 39 protein, partial [Deltaproteobacteria bacterium]|nr:glycosyltransferase family 39 protein [Deltaproteobacteria bacterium]